MDLSANTLNQTLAATDQVTVAGGRMIARAATATTASSIGAAKIGLGGGTFVSIGGPGAVTETAGAAGQLTEFWYQLPGNPPESILNPISNLFQNIPAGNRPLTGPLANMNDANTFIPVWGDGDSVAALWFGEMTFTTDGASGNTYTFASNTDDGSTWWIDLNDDGQFGAGEMVLDNNVYQGPTARAGLTRTGGTSSVTVPAGTHKVALGFYEGGVTGLADFKFGRGNITIPADDPATTTVNENQVAYNTGTTLTQVNPSDSSIATFRGRSYTLAASSDPSFAANAVDATANTTIESQGSTRFGPLTMASGVTLTKTGGIVGFSTATVNAGTATINSDLNGVELGDVTIGGGATLVMNNSNNNKITGTLSGTGTLRTGGNGVIQFTKNGTAVSGTPILTIPTPTALNGTSTFQFGPGAGNTLTATAVTAIGNDGLLRASSGTTDLSNAVITTTYVQPPTVAGLLEGRLPGAFNTTDPNPGTSNNPTVVGGIKLEPVLAQISGNGNIEPWPDNTTHVYTGQILIPDNDVAGDGMGSFSMAEHFDDSTQIKIDGIERLNNGQWDIPNTTGVLTMTAGWHDLELRFGEGGGGWGPSNSGPAGSTPETGLWNNTLGFGIDFEVPIHGANPPIQANFTRPVDNGSMNLFRFVAPRYGKVQVDPGAVLKVAQLVGTNDVIVQGRLQLHGATTKLPAPNLQIAGTAAAPTGTLDLTDSALATRLSDHGADGRRSRRCSLADHLRPWRAGLGEDLERHGYHQQRCSGRGGELHVGRLCGRRHDAFGRNHDVPRPDG